MTSILLLVSVSACVTVRPEDKELLSDPTMVFGEDEDADGQENHIFVNREGSFGATGVSGGGCGCN